MAIQPTTYGIGVSADLLRRPDAVRRSSPLDAGWFWYRAGPINQLNILSGQKDAWLALWPPGTQEVACRLPGLAACTMVQPDKGQINPQLSCRISGDCPGRKRQQRRQHGISTAFSVLVHENGLTGGVGSPVICRSTPHPPGSEKEARCNMGRREEDGGGLSADEKLRNMRRKKPTGGQPMPSCS